MQAIGVQNIRVFVPWGLVEYTDNSYYWNAIDAVVSAAAARNMGVMAEVNATPVWDDATLPLGSGTPDPDKFAEFMKAFVGRTTPDGYSYANTISAYEIWNEPNAVLFSNPIDPVAYATMARMTSGPTCSRPCYPIIKGTATTPGLDPTATVVAGALGQVFTVDGYTMDPVEFVQAMCKQAPEVPSTRCRITPTTKPRNSPTGTSPLHGPLTPPTTRSRTSRP